MILIFRVVMVMVFLGGHAVAQEAGVKASLRFQIWAGEVSKGVQAVGKESDERERYQGEFYVKVGEEYKKVVYREGRRSEKLDYQGARECVMYKGQPDADGVPVKLASFVLPGSGEFMVVLKVAGSVKDPKFTPLLLPYSDRFLKKGAVSVVNYTDKELVVAPNALKKLALKPGARGVVSLGSGAVPSVHLKVASRVAGGEWEGEFSRSYALMKDSKTACLFYQDKPGGAVRVKFYSGLEK